MHITLKEVLATAAVLWAGLQVWWAKFAPVIEPIVREIEADCLAGEITKDQRKQIAMDTIDAFQKNGTIKLSWIQKLVLSKVVDIIADRLPNFKVSQSVKDIIAQLPK